jgi:hypothetical protein
MDETDQGDIGVNERMILKFILKVQSVRIWNGFMWLRTGTRGGLL